MEEMRKPRRGRPFGTAITKPEPLLRPLRPREIEVLELLTQGLRYKDIADELGISPHTVKFHISNAYRALGVDHDTHAVAVYLTNKLSKAE